MNVIRGCERKLSGRIVKGVASIFDPSLNPTYGSHYLTHKILKICRENSSAEQESSPSPDVILRRLHQVDESEFREVLESLNKFLLRNIALPDDPAIAVDFKTLPYYGEEQPSLVSDPVFPERTSRSSLWS